ncbi:MAG: HAMP domain-containing histidine kinase [Ruminococcaceae bacterium]|nr:HAMP domain-containing histidine kinase [Oscillospiraceae bacterium]
MKRKKARSISNRLNRWYTVLMGVLCAGLILSVVAVARTTENAAAQQNLIRTVERNIDEIEVENGLLDIESDFAYRNDGVYAVVYSSEGSILGGEYPEGMQDGIPLEEKRFDKFDGYYVYDTKVEFTKYDYKINGESGEIISSEVEGADYYTPFEGDLDFYGDDCEISCGDAFDIAVKKSGLDPAGINIINVKSYEYNDDPIYEVEFYSTQKAYDDIWVRGIVQANDADSVWSILAQLAAILLPLLLIVCSVVGRIITKKALAPVGLLRDAVEEIHSGKDLTKRVTVADAHADPLLSSLADKFNEMFSRLQLSFESERQFSGDVSHELRTPTAVILAECEYQLSREELDEEDKEGFEGIQKQAESMKKLISQLLEMTKMEQSEGQLSFEREDFGLLVNAVCDDLKAVDTKNITLTADVDEGIFMDMDVLLLTRLVTNLVSNSFTYTNEGGSIRVSLKADGEKIRLSVADNGVGIAKEHLQKIWNRFYRVDKARSREEGCSGLGLAMVRQIALLHGGEVSLESEVGKGSTFSVVFDKK